MTVPMANRATCELCGEALDTRQTTIFQHASGWLRNRDKGANAVALAVREHRFACLNCIDRLRAGIPIGQMSIYDVGAGEP